MHLCIWHKYRRIGSDAEGITSRDDSKRKENIRVREEQRVCVCVCVLVCVFVCTVPEDRVLF